VGADDARRGGRLLAAAEFEEEGALDLLLLLLRLARVLVLLLVLVLVLVLVPTEAAEAVFVCVA
jgi:hypothetical protein